MVKTKSDNQNSSKKAIRKPSKKITESYLHNSGLYYLERFSTSTANFRRVMMRKVDNSCREHTDQDRTACAQWVEELIEKFQRAGLLNDEVYARGLTNSLRRRGLSSRAIAAKLATKGLKSLPSENSTSEDDLRAAVRFTQRKRLGPFAKPKDGQVPDRKKELSALARAGFGYELAHRVLNLTREEAEDIMINAS